MSRLFQDLEHGVDRCLHFLEVKCRPENGSNPSAVEKLAVDWGPLAQKSIQALRTFSL